MIYLDQAATSFPKPPSVIAAVCDHLTHLGANPGRSGHSLSVQAARSVYACRERLARFIGASDARQVIFTPNATVGLNLILLGYLNAGDHVVTTSMEHNSVTRPLRFLRETRDVRITVVRADDVGRISAKDVGTAVKADTRMVVINHASNIVGTIAPIADIRKAIGEVPLMVDAAQTLGAIPIDVTKENIDLLAFSGHKGLLGPQGVGGLYLRTGFEVKPLILGGTGSGSESDRQPTTLPDQYESGTPNGPGIAGLAAGLDHLLQLGPDVVRAREAQYRQLLWAGLSEIPRVTLYGPPDPGCAMPVIAMRIDGLSPNEVTQRLDRDHNVLTRSGLQCAPEAHRTLGTFPEGTVRVSAGIMNTPEELERAVDAVRVVAKTSCVL